MKKMEKNEQLTFKQRTIKRILPTLLFSLAIPFITCICIPFEIFANNIEQFVFSVKDFLPLSILISLGATIIFFFSLLFLPEKAYRIVASIYLALAFLFFIQSNYLNVGVRSLAGDGLGSSISLVSKIINLFVWLLVLGVAVFFAVFKKWHDILSMVAVGLCAVITISSLMSPFVLAISTKNVFKTKAERVNLNGEDTFNILTTKNLTNISSNGNVFIFVVDVMDKTFVEEAIEKRPEIFNSLDGFTYFEDNLSLFGHTFPSVANIITGAEFEVTKERSKYLNNAYQNAVPLDILDENGYQINIFSQGFYAYEDASYMPSYVSNVSEAVKTNVKHPFLLTANFIQIALYRCFPLFLKNLVGNVDSAETNNFVSCEDENGYKQYSTDLKEVYNTIQSSKDDGKFTTINDKKVFSLVHVYGCHSIKYNANWQKPTGKDRNDITLSLMNSFSIINEYIKAMKDIGVYEESTILILGDHGKPINDLKDLSRPIQTGLFIKQKGAGNVAGEGYKISSSQVSHSQIWSTIFDSENITLTPEQQEAYNQTTFKKLNPEDKSHFDILEDENVTRYYFWHTYAGDCDEYKYKITGAGNNFNNWEMYEHIHTDKFLMN
ncbi:MAG: hypothetical protein IKW33_01025 [Clostridia bacterium]|nr:hypothetical protein [Clostridia bacterium]